MALVCAIVVYKRRRAQARALAGRANAQAQSQPPPGYAPGTFVGASGVGQNPAFVNGPSPFATPYQTGQTSAGGGNGYGNYYANYAGAGSGVGEGGAPGMGYGAPPNGQGGSNSNGGYYHQDAFPTATASSGNPYYNVEANPQMSSFYANGGTVAPGIPLETHPPSTYPNPSPL